MTDGTDLVAHDQYLEGNANMVHQFFMNKTGKERLRVAYFGDHFWSDAYASSTFTPSGFSVEQPKWDGILVMEDLWWQDNESSEGKDPMLNDNSAFFSNNFFVNEVNGAQIKDYYVAELEKTARYAVPFVKNISRLIR